MAAGRLVERPLSLSRQEMVVAWTRERFLNLSIVDTLGWMWGRRGEGCPVHCRMLTCSRASTRQVPVQPPTHRGNQRCLRTLPNVLWGRKMLLVEHLGPGG